MLNTTFQNFIAIIFRTNRNTRFVFGFVRVLPLSSKDSMAAELLKHEEPESFYSFIKLCKAVVKESSNTGKTKTVKDWFEDYDGKPQTK